MRREEMERKLIEIVRKEKEISPDLLSPATPLADAGIDSLDSLTILFAIEEEFRITIPDARAKSLATFGDLADAVAEQLPLEV